MLRKKRDFYYDKGNYLWKLKPKLELNYFTPRIIFQFGIVLPFFIPFPDKSELFYKINYDELCHFMFSNVEDKQSIYTGSYQNDGSQVTIKRTRVEVTYSFKQNVKLSNGADTKYLNKVFDESLNKLNNVIQAYTAKTKDNKVYRLTKENFDIALFFRISNGKNYKELKSFLFTLHMNPPDMCSNYLTFEETDEIMKYIDIIGDKLNPFIFPNEILIDGRRSFNLGNYKQAIINAQTSVETFMYLIYREFLKQEGVTASDIDLKSKQMRLKSLVQDQFSKRLGGDFNVDNPNTRVGKWWLHTYFCRNKVVHEGYHPSFEECDNALYYATDIMEYILDLIYEPENINKYPEVEKYIR